MLKEFKHFAMRGNVVDMAIGIILGTTFGKIVSSFVSDVLMPPLGLLIGQVDFADFAITLKAQTAHAEAVTLNYGKFINTLVDFVIIAFAIFMVVSQLNKLLHKPLETTKNCPRCCASIPIAANRCGHCTSEL